MAVDKNIAVTRYCYEIVNIVRAGNKMPALNLAIINKLNSIIK